MLVKITNRCQMQCTHCMDKCGPVGEDMPPDVFDNVVEFIVKNGFLIAMISGGEPTDHPRLTDYVGRAQCAGLKVIILSNGLFLQDDRRERVLGLNVPIQIYNDPRYYPIKVEPEEHPNIAIFATKINGLVPQGRATGMKTDRTSPPCFNLRSITRSVWDFRNAVLSLRMMGKMCTPSINVDGSIVAGECRTCYKIGTVNSSNMELTNALAEMRCNQCGLVDNLDDKYKRVIGEF